MEANPCTSRPAPRRNSYVDQLRSEKAICPTPTAANRESVDLGKSFEKYWGRDVKDKQRPDGDVPVVVCYFKIWVARTVYVRLNLCVFVCGVCVFLNR